MLVKGLLKIAADPVVFSNLGKSLVKGVREAGSATVKDTLKLKGLKHIADATKASGGVKKSFTSQAGRERMAEAVGKAAPSIGALSAYGYAAKKTYDKVNESNRDPGYY